MSSQIYCGQVLMLATNRGTVYLLEDGGVNGQGSSVGFYFLGHKAYNTLSRSRKGNKSWAIKHRTLTELRFWIRNYVNLENVAWNA
jgi:hypothetical protein